MAISESVTNTTTDKGNVDEEDEKPRTLFVGNVPREIHKREIEEVFGDIGPLKRCYIQYPRDGNEKKRQREDTTVAYVTFALAQDATKALETLQNTKIGDNRINIKFARARSEQSRHSFDRIGAGGGDGGRRGFGKNANFEPVGGVPPKPKEPRPKPIKKKSRLIVRNLSFKVTDEKLKKYFEQIGEVKDINILKKPNGKLVGCAFIQYQNIFQASKAIKELNAKEFLGRPIAIDWALPKDKYQTEEEKLEKAGLLVPQENVEAENVVIKDEPDSDAEDTKNLDESMDVDVIEIKEEKDSSVGKSKGKQKRKRDNSESEDDDDLDSSDQEEKISPKKKSKQISNDVEEGKTLFLRNLSFDTTEQELKQFFEKFGQLEYALLCKDSLTEHPKGTGFIKFKLKSAADQCLNKYAEDEEEFRLNRRQFNVSVALPRGKVSEASDSKMNEGRDKQQNKKKTDVKPKADSRNLYLAREGFVRPGSAAAEDVSASDMAKRASLNKVKKQMLKNLNILISPTRICIHNLPEKYSDTQLRKLFKKHAPPGAKITEARVMRDLKEIQLDGKGISKGYGFINFMEHEDALKALRAVNNNPTVFTPNHRPIVEFSMENRLALRAKEKRALKSKEKNPNNPKKKVESEKHLDSEEENEENDDEEGQDEEGKQKTGAKGKSKKNKKVKAKTEENGEDGGGDGNETGEGIPKFAGLKGKKGVQTLPLFKFKGKITRNSLKQKKSKKEKKIQERRLREPKIHSKRPADRIDKTEKIIAKHQKKLNSGGDSGKKTKKKWYE